MSPVGRSVIASVCILCLAGRPMRASAASAFAGALEPTQVANFIQLIEHSVRFGKMVKQGKDQVDAWKRNLSSFNAHDLVALYGFVKGIDTYLAAYRAITFGARSSLDDFKATHPGYVVPADGKRAYRELEQQTLGTATRTLQQMDVQLNSDKGLKSDLQLAKELQSKIQGADGTLKALQIADELLVLLNVQMSKLIATLSTHASQMAMYEANEVQRRAYQEATRDQVLGVRPTASRRPVDWSTEAFRGFQ